MQIRYYAFLLLCCHCSDNDRIDSRKIEPHTPAGHYLSERQRELLSEARQLALYIRSSAPNRTFFGEVIAKGWIAHMCDDVNRPDLSARVPGSKILDDDDINTRVSLIICVDASLIEGTNLTYSFDNERWIATDRKPTP